ncbi:hypothetical protein U1Q18_023976 [Sarracenia purpurea var. burkii]
MGAKTRKTDSPKVEVGEIDTRAPFQSVKDAVNLFGEGAFSRDKPSIKKAKAHSAERVSAKETQLHSAQKELNKLKEQLVNAETTKTQALVELEKVKRTAEDLTQKLRSVTESKESALDETEATKKNQGKQLEETNSCYPVAANGGAGKLELESKREQYMTAIIELDTAKQLLRQIRQNCDATLKVEAFSFDQASEAEHGAKTNIEKSSELSEEKASDLDSIGNVTSELDDAKDSIHKVAEEESALQRLVEILKLELDNVRKEHSELKEKEAEMESIAGNLLVKLRKSKYELEATALAEDSKVRDASVERISSESEDAKCKANEMKKKAEELKKEAEATRIAWEEAEKTLRVELEEAEEAKAAETRALHQMKILSDRTKTARASAFASGAQITISRQEFEILSRKVEESDELAEMKVAAAMAQVEAVKSSESDGLKMLELTQKEIDDMKAAMREAVERAEMAEAAKKAVEGELRRWREREKKKAAEAAPRLLAETEIMSSESSSPSPQYYRVQKQNPPKKVLSARWLEKERTTSSIPKKGLFPNLSSIFRKKKNRFEEGSPSYLPGEMPF